ncbi:MAG: carbohydrate ABC transporter permease [bacterium]|nr:carbohydrate ABC transporter permease [bacterium]
MSWFTYLVLTIAVAVSIFPFYWMFVVGSNSTEAINDIPPAVVPGGNFPTLVQQVFDSGPFIRAMFNSLIVATTIAVVQVVFSTLAGFAFAKLKFRGRNVLFVLVIGTMMVPVQLGIIPLFLEMRLIGWVNSLLAVVFPGFISAFGVFWMRQLIEGAVPDELLEAARVDGASTFRMYRTIVLPLVRSGASVLGLFAFMFAWNDFLWPLVVLNDPDSYTVQVALRQIQNQAYITDFGVQMAGTVVATVPLLLIFLLLGRQIIGGIMEGALKS